MEYMVWRLSLCVGFLLAVAVVDLIAFAVALCFLLLNRAERDAEKGDDL